VIYLSALSTDYIHTKVSAQSHGVDIDPTGDEVFIAFMPPGTDPTDADWHDAEWEAFGANYWAKCLVGPAGGVALSKGAYVMWVKVVDSPEVPVIPAGSLVIT
jgi:hypothetical protein